MSVGVRDMVCRLAADADFRTAAENLHRLAQVKLSHETVRRLAEGEGAAVLAAENDGTLPAGWSAEDGAVEGTAITRVYVGVDGVTVPTVTEAEKKLRRKKARARRRRCGRKRRPLPRLSKGTDQRWKEAKLVAFYSQDKSLKLVSAAVEDSDAAGRRMRRDARRINLSRADDRLGVFDGADCIRNQVKGQSLPLDGVCLDFFHLAENVHTCRRVVFGDSDDPAGEGMKWAADVLHAAKHDGFEALRERLADLRSAMRRNARKKTAVDRLTDYVVARREMMNHAEWLACGRDIGSGPTESLCKTVPMRLKGPGMKWNVAGADAMMALTGLRRTGRWELWWTIRRRTA